MYVCNVILYSRDSEFASCQRQLLWRYELFVEVGIEKHATFLFWQFVTLGIVVY